jgi:hypothetical protein
MSEIISLNAARWGLPAVGELCAGPISAGTGNRALPSWLRISGELGGRYEGFLAGGFQRNNDDLYLLSRVRFDMRIKPTSWLQFRFETQDARVHWKTQKPYGAPFQDTWNLRLAYVTVGDSIRGQSRC